MVYQSPQRDIKPMMIGCDSKKWRDVQPLKPMRRGSLVGAEAKAASAASAAVSIIETSSVFTNVLPTYLDTKYLPLETKASSNDSMRKSRSLSSINKVPSLDRIASKRRKTKSCPKLKLSPRTKRKGSKDDDAGMGNAMWSTPLQTIEEFRSSCSKKREKKSKSRCVRSQPSLFSKSDVQEEHRPSLRRRSSAPALNLPSTIKLSS